MGELYTHTPKEAQALATCKGLKKIKLKKRIFIKKKGLALIA
jgi:hypothetical protein